MNRMGWPRWFLAAIVALTALCAGWFLTRPVEAFNRFSQMRLLVTGAHSRYIAVAGYRIHYYVMGPERAPAVVLVHGLGGRSEDWTNLAPYLVEAGYRLYLPDLPGFGRSQKPTGFSYSIPDQAKVMGQFLDTLDMDRVDLGGWSMGGWIVQRMAAARPERVRRLMLFDSAGLAAMPDWDTALFTPTSAAKLDELDRLLMPQPPQVPGFVARDILRTSSQNAWVIHRALATMLTGRDVTDRLLPGFKMPVLIVWGELDHITPLRQGQAMHDLVPQSQLKIVPGCGHLAPSQCAGAIGPTVVSFLRQ